MHRDCYTALIQFSSVTSVPCKGGTYGLKPVSLRFPIKYLHASGYLARKKCELMKPIQFLVSFFKQTRLKIIFVRPLAVYGNLSDEGQLFFQKAASISVGKTTYLHLLLVLIQTEGLLGGSEKKKPLEMQVKQALGDRFSPHPRAKHVIRFDKSAEKVLEEALKHSRNRQRASIILEDLFHAITQPCYQPSMQLAKRYGLENLSMYSDLPVAVEENKFRNPGLAVYRDLKVNNENILQLLEQLDRDAKLKNEVAIMLQANIRFRLPKGSQVFVIPKAEDNVYHILFPQEHESEQREEQFCEEMFIVSKVVLS